ncbi:MAG: methionyl-tRNA formyltransferase [Deltaproteobacteria bacterium]|nr:methionyl-tRNA formyltransferase [Deltaproteobacteria bacterium]MBW1748049.1 methionyl-tRNA formyltransferase [Deltaproteobacteria bacterium]MBW1826008.1 methionyl-tRNA formyltransferase [Deltaproteobacteria bacterium]MBW1968802.1 methionyl-tRNA formyltransferase [Deltaproteobacteria bacterium]MBW2155271.1 methionyl-tRNA formyltransferase [Deltaproteobacteria bacterium]
MRILLIGQAAFGANVLEKLMDRNENVVAVYAPTDRPGGRMDPLKDAAVSKGIDVFQPTTYKDDRVFSEYNELKPDLTVMAFVTDIIPARFFEVPTHGTINYHPSLLPRHRGASAINWAVIMGDSKTGLNIFWPDGGIDTGPILLQKEIAIGPDDTTGSLYFNHLFPMGVDAILESIDLIKAGNAPKILQDEVGATYEPPCDDKVAGIDWNKPADELYNLVRGCDPQPGAFAVLGGEKVRFYGAKRIEETVVDAPGTILDVDDKGIHIALSGGRLVVGKVRPAKGGKVAASDFAAEQGIKAGDMFDR